MHHDRLRAGFIGQGPDTDRWRFACADVADVIANPDADTPVDAMIIASNGPDAFARAKAALDLGVPVLYAAPALLSPWQAQALVNASRRRGALLRFAEPYQHHSGFTFLRRLLTGDEPFWPALYIRSTNLAPCGTRLDELASEELGACDALIDRPVRRVSAAASRADAVGGVSALFLTIEYEGGALVQSTVSVAEPARERRLVAATPGRSMVLDWLDQHAPLRFLSAHDDVQHPSTPVEQATVDPFAGEVAAFVAALHADDRTVENGVRFARLAAIWWAGRESMSFGETVDVTDRRFLIEDAEPPPLRVIEGGGPVAARPRSRPTLTVVAS